MISAEELFVRRFDDLAAGLQARDDYDLLKVAAILRQLLADEHPLVHQANAATRLKLRFRVNSSRLPADALPVKPAIHLMGLGLDPTAVTTAGGAEDLNLDRFLKVVMITGDDGDVTVLDVIKHAANKAGGVHYGGSAADPQPVDAFVAKLSAVGVHALALALQTIARITLAALVPLRRALVRLPEDLVLFAHYKLPSGAISFSGQGQFLEANLDHVLGTGWSWNGVVRVRRQAEAGERVLYELGNPDDSPPCIRLTYAENGTLSAILRPCPGTEVRAAAPHFDQSPFFEAFTYVRMDVQFPTEETLGELALFLNNDRVARVSFPASSIPRTVTRQVIGSDLAAQCAAAFDIQEVVIVDHALSVTQAASIAKYFWLEWHG